MKQTLNHIDMHGKRVLIRVDFNVPMKNGMVVDNSRIKAAIPTILEVIKRKGKPILLSHLGRPKDGEAQRKFSLLDASKELEELLRPHGVSVVFSDECVGKTAKSHVQSLMPKQALLLENLRFHKEETSKNKDERAVFARELASLGDVYIMEAFGNAHRKHASCYELALNLPSAIGFLINEELNILNIIENDVQHPFMLLLGGAKVSDKIPLIAKLIHKVDMVLIGGGMAFTFLKAKGYNIGRSLLDEVLVKSCKLLLDNFGNKIVLPNDVKVGNFNFHTMELETLLENVPVDKIPEDLEGLDIGNASLKKFQSILMNAKTVVWNGPLGVYEYPQTALGTDEVAKTLCQLTANGATTIVGGGDSGAAVQKTIEDLNGIGGVTHISTGGGAFLEALKGNALPGLHHIRER